MLAETCARVGEHTGSSSQTQGRLPGGGHILAKFSRTSGLCLDKEGGRGVSGRGVSSTWGGPEMAGAMLHWAWCEQARVRGVLEGWRSWRGKARRCGLADSLRRAPMSNREPRRGLSWRPGGHVGATRKLMSAPDWIQEGQGVMTNMGCGTSLRRALTLVLTSRRR